MVTIESVKAYMALLHNTVIFDELESLEQDKAVFSALELLKDKFAEEKLTDRAVALQVLFMLEGEAGEFAMLQRQGVKSYKVKDLSVTFSGAAISPDVIDILGGGSSGAAIGRLI